MRNVPFFAPNVAKYGARVADTIAEGNIGPGRRVHDFERSFARYLSMEKAVAAGSGTSALQAACVIVSEEQGSEVVDNGVFLAPAYGIAATANAASSLGFNVEFVDIDPVWGCMDPAKLRARIEQDGNEDAGLPRIIGVLWVHFSGVVAPYFPELAEWICDVEGQWLIEDAACAFGARGPDGGLAGNYGDIGCFSFSVPKLITTGQGGILVGNPEHVELARQILSNAGAGRNHLSWNSRMTDIQAALGLPQLRDFDRIAQQRLSQFRDLNARLQNRGVGFLFGEDFSGLVPPLHNIILIPGVPNNLIAAHLNAKGIGAMVQYATVPRLPLYANWKGAQDPQAFPVADAWAKHAVYLPFGRKLTDVDHDAIVDALAQVLAELKPNEGTNAG